MAWYSPQRVEQIFRQALAGDLASQWEMFDLMESTWPCLSKCLNQLKDAAVCRGIRVAPWAAKRQEPTEEAVRRAALVEECLHGMRPDLGADENDFDDTIRDLMDARGKGLSVLEVDWEVRAGVVAPRCTRWAHPVWYGYPFGAGSGRLKLRVARGASDAPGSSFPGDTSAGFGLGNRSAFVDFPAHKFLIGMCKNKTGHPLGAALLHVLGFWWAASNFTADWFLNFCQVFGQPFRWATYDPSMTPDDQAKLQLMLTSMGANAWGMFPAGTAFELKDVAAKSSDNIQIALMELADKVCTLLVLRQTLTSDVQDSGSRSLGEVHERVLGGVEEALTRWLCNTLAPLVRSICVLNFGDERELPVLELGMDEEASPEDLAKLLVDVNNAGLQAKDDALEELSERLGFGVERKALAGPVDGLGMWGGVGRVDERDESDGDWRKAVAGADQRPGVAPGGGREAALARAYAGSMAPFRQIILESNSREECLARLARAYADWKPERLAAELETALQLAAAAGAAQTAR